jgi:hypothetical protein
MRPDRRTYEQFMRESEGNYDELEMNQWVAEVDGFHS